MQNYRNSIYNCLFFKNKKILIAVPHQDDELIIAGAILPILRANGCDIFVLYSTNGDYHGERIGKVRQTEAKAYCALNGIPESNLFFMGYHDFGEKKEHWYSDESEKNAFKSKLKAIVTQIRSDIIFCIDCDIHSDHIALSLCMEDVISDLIREDNYKPLFFKAFAHDNLWMGMGDFYAANLGACLDLKDNPNRTYSYRLQDAFYGWENRVRFPISEEYFTRTALKNKYRKQAKCYKSQHVKYHFTRLLNSDQVYFLRRTDNLVLRSSIQASSGDVSPLQTMKMIEPKQIWAKDGLLENDDFYWHPDENDQIRELSFEFDGTYDIDRIVVYTDEGKTRETLFKETYETNTIKLHFEEKETRIRYIEIFEKRPAEKAQFIKIVNKDNFIYAYNKTKAEQMEVGVYYFDGISGTILKADDERVKVRYEGNKVMAAVTNQPDVYDSAKIVNRSRFSEQLYVEWGKLALGANRLIYKLVRTIRKTM